MADRRPFHYLGDFCALIGRVPNLVCVLEFASFTLAYYLAYRFGMSFSQTSASPFWFPDSVLLCGLLRAQPKQWWLLILITLPIRYLSEFAREIPLWFLIVCAAIDSAKGLAAAILLRLSLKHPMRFENVRDFAIYCLIAVITVPAVSAFFAAWAAAAKGLDYWLFFEQWFMGDALTQLVITPFVFYWIFGTPWRKVALEPAQFVEASVLAVGLIVASFVACTVDRSSSVYFAESRFYAPMPFLFWAAIRFGMLGATGAVGLLAILVVEAVLVGRGPFAQLSPNDTALSLQNYLLLRAAPLFLAAAYVDRIVKIEAALRESEERFRNMANTTSGMFWMANAAGECTFVNKAYCDFTARPLQHQVGFGWLQSVHVDDLRDCMADWKAAQESRARLQTEFRLQRHDGTWRRVFSVGEPHYSTRGEFMGHIGTLIEVADQSSGEPQDQAAQ